MENIIEISNLSKSFGEIKAVDNLSFCVKRGELFAFLGVNGAGNQPLSTLCAADFLRTAEKFSLTALI